MKKIGLLLGVLITFSSFAQEDNGISYCGTTQIKNRLFNDSYSWKLQDSLDQAQLSDWTQQYIESGMDNQRGVVYVIPVVFHIVHLGGAENISNAQIMDALRILNEDYRKVNSDTSLIVSAFKAIAGDAEIEFRLATRNNAGACHPGITRTYSQHTYDTGPSFGGHSIVTAVSNQHGTWPSNKYMNVYICIDPAGAAGYTNTPNTWLPINNGQAGIFINHSYVGSIGTGALQRARALTHEVGHWLNLQHTWGPSNEPNIATNCNDDDGVTDTPNTIGWISCNLNGNTCSSLDNVQNYMEYSYCSRMFTEGQVVRMRAALNDATGGRNNLWTPANLAATGVATAAPLCKAEFLSNTDVICEGQTVTYTDISYHGATGRTWTFPGGSPATSTDSVVTVTYDTPGYYAVTLVATDGTNSVSETKNNNVRVLAAANSGVPLVEGFETGGVLSDDWFTPWAPDNKWAITGLAASSGQYAMRVPNTASMSGSTHNLISNTINTQFMSDVTVSFKYAFAKRNSNNTDVLKFMVSNNCGLTWNTRKTINTGNIATAPNTTTNYVPAASHWKEEIITNVTSFFFSPTFRIRFEFTAGGGNNLYLDDINISGAVGVIHISEDYYNLAIVPNPSDGIGTMIQFELKETEKYSLEVYDPAGRKVTDVATNSSGYGLVRHNLSNVNMASGLYFVRLTIGNQVITERMVIQ